MSVQSSQAMSRKQKSTNEEVLNLKDRIAILESELESVHNLLRDASDENDILKVWSCVSLILKIHRK